MVLALTWEGTGRAHCLLLLWPVCSRVEEPQLLPPACWNSLKAAFQEGRGRRGQAQGEQQWPQGSHLWGTVWL